LRNELLRSLRALMSVPLLIDRFDPTWPDPRVYPYP